MRRTLWSWTIFTLIVASWLVITPTMGFPATGRRTTLTDTTSAHRRDGLIAGSDFLNMFIGTTVSPSIRSRRYPITRPGIEYRNRLYHERRIPSRATTQSRFSQSENHDADPRDNYTENLESNYQLSGLVRSQDRQNYHSQRQFAGKDTRTEEQQRDVRKFSNSADTFKASDAGAVSADRMISDAMASDARVFGVRTFPRTGKVQMSTSSTSEAAIQAEDSFNYEVSDEVHRNNPNEDSSLNNLNVSDIKVEQSNTNPSDNSDDIPREVAVANVNNVPESPRFSVSSSVHTETAKRIYKMPRLQNPVTVSDVFSSTSPVEIDDETTQRLETTSTQESEYLSNGNSQSTVDSISYSTTVGEESSTMTTVVDVETTTETNEDWSTKSEEFPSEQSIGGDRIHTSDTTPSHVDDDSQNETPIQVISVRVSSSVGQSASSSHSSQQNNAVFNTILEEPSSIVDPPRYIHDETPDISAINTANLVTEEQPPATSIQRSDFSVEEASPSEVTADPHLAYSSFHSSRFQSPSTSYYQSSSEETSSSDPRVALVNYQTRFNSGTSGSRGQFFGKPLRGGRRGPPIAQRRAILDSTGSVEASVVESNRRSYTAHLVPRSRVFVENHSTSKAQSLNKEPVSVAESIQRSVIANQDGERSDARSLTNRGQYHQDKFDIGTGSQRSVEDGKYTEDQKSKIDIARGRKSFHLDDSIQKSYNQPEKMYGEPAKNYGEPAKVYGEPAKVYGEPSKVYSEPAKVYGVPSKIYGEPSKVYGEPSKVYGEPAKVYGEPAKVYGEPSKNYGVPEQNYEVDETVSVMTNGRAHGVQPKTPEVTPPPSQVDTAMKVFDTRQQDPNHKVGYVLEGRDYRKYRVEERTSDGFIVGEYGVVSNDGGNLRGVRYTADGTINPRLIYDTLLKFLSL